ncbi:hypothetical protein JAAARDRAFT_38294 [Jaapia argillacea MUCL 33604]|uniref:Uncharacterized protein n=1 Tax=Jaapia argillacea MUCL 33604 TaxID=933084 RepID=A0A067PI71_9AGAM|nr:hypothetical protein JAAARDRAFT_38294 [Jaapia argillacea MUCL 33604]
MYHSNGRDGGYDESLLVNAPATSRAERQVGYDIDILEEPVTQVGRNNSVYRPPILHPLISHSESGPFAGIGDGNQDTPTGSFFKERFTPSPHRSTPPSSSRSRKGRSRLILLVVLVGVVIIAAVVGGVVGSRKHHTSDIASIVPGPSNPTSSGTSSSSAVSQMANSVVGQSTTQTGTQAPKATNSGNTPSDGSTYSTSASTSSPPVFPSTSHPSSGSSTTPPGGLESQTYATPSSSASLTQVS